MRGHRDRRASGRSTATGGGDRGCAAPVRATARADGHRCVRPAFRSAVQPMEIAAALQREVDNSAQILSRDRRLAPNDFHVDLSAADYDRLVAVRPRRWPTSSPRCCASTRRSSTTSSPARSRSSFERGDDLTTGRFRVRSAALAEVTPVAERAPTETAVRRAPLILEVNGIRHPLEPPGLVDRPRHRGRPAHQRPGRVAAGTSSSGSQPRRRRRHRRSSVARPRLHQRHAGQRPPGAAGHARRRRRVQIGNTTMTVRSSSAPRTAPDGEAGRCLSSP